MYGNHLITGYAAVHGSVTFAHQLKLN
jgi:hypothetical protein